MKLVSHFDTFLSDIVNLNTTRIQQLTDSIEALKVVLQNSDWTPKIKYFLAHGSWAHQTIIKPIDYAPFDADLLIFIEPVEGWSAKTYLSSLRKVFAEHGVYKDKLRRYSHCITIEYAGERKIDLAPCIINRAGLTRFEVCNYNTDAFELTEPKKYTDWFIDRNKWTGRNGLRKVTRLLKYLRDIKETFSCPSVLFTTLLGARINWADSLDETNFADVPTALRTIVGRLDDWLQLNAVRPTVNNPVLPSEVFSNLWNDDKYKNFREKIHTYRTWIDDAYTEEDKNESIGKWRRVFGDDFAKSTAIAQAARVSDDARRLIAAKALVQPGYDGDLVQLITRFGRQALPSGFDRLPHKRRPYWRSIPDPLGSPLFKVNVVASSHTSRHGHWIGIVTSGATLLQKTWCLKFEAQTEHGYVVSNDYDIHWRVANTDQEAQQANCLRGGFEPSNDRSARWEPLKFRGVHTVEAFVVRKSDHLLVAQSEPFYVVIE